MVLLTPEEVDYQIDYAFKHNKDLPIEVLLKPIVCSSNKAQLKKVAKELERIYETSNDLRTFEDEVEQFTKVILKEVE